MLISYCDHRATGTQESEVTIDFKLNDDLTAPVNPDKPGEEIGEVGTGAGGPLSIDYISSLSFGESDYFQHTAKI